MLVTVCYTACDTFIPSSRYYSSLVIDYLYVLHGHRTVETDL